MTGQLRGHQLLPHRGYRVIQLNGPIRQLRHLISPSPGFSPGRTVIPCCYRSIEDHVPAQDHTRHAATRDTAADLRDRGSRRHHRAQPIKWPRRLLADDQRWASKSVPVPMTPLPGLPACDHRVHAPTPTGTLSA
jgi:hypothetical protein